MQARGFVRDAADLCSIGGGQKQDALSALETIQLGQQLVQGLIPLLVDTNASPAACKQTLLQRYIQCFRAKYVTI